MNYKVQTRNQTDIFSNVKFWLLTLIIILIYSAFIFAQNVVYIDPTNSGDPAQDGSINHPYDKWNDFSIQSNKTYLQKKGTTYTIPAYSNAAITSNNLNNVVIGTYGTGSKPIIQDPNGQVDRLVDIRLTQGFTIDGFNLIGAPGVNGTGVGIQLQGSNNTSERPNKYIHIYNCDIHSVGTGTWYIPYETPYGSQAEDFQLVNCNIYDIQDDGVFWVEVADIRIEGCHIHDVAQNVGNGGDGVHIVEGCPNYLIKDNIIDRRGSVDKFCFIHGASATWTGTYGRITGNTFYSPDNDPNWGGAAVYLAVHDHVTVDHNKFIEGGQCAIFTQFEEDITISYNLFYNISGGGVIEASNSLKILNNTIVSDQTGFWFLFNVGGDGVCQYWNNIEASNDMDLGEGVKFAYGNWDKKNNLIKTTNPSTWGNYFGFVNYASGDLHITQNSIAVNAGYTYNGYNYDLDNNSIAGIRDRGSYEYTDGGSTINNPPVISNQSFSVSENTANGTPVGTVIATDPDVGQSLSYSIISGNTSNAFQINASTGALTVNNSSVLNYEVVTSFALIVKAQDNGQGNLFSQATITVNITNVNENPNISNQTFTIAENSLTGMQAGVVVASDPDAGQSLSYSIISGNTNNAFQINAATGALTVLNPSALNYELVTSYALIVKAQDNGQGNLFSQATITVNITNVNENPNISNQTFTIAENSLVGVQAGVVVASDPDAGQSLSYSIISGNTNNAFQINAATGTLTVLNPSALNYELVTSFALIVKAQDNGQGNLFSQATITVNVTNVNENPNISNQTFSIAENSLIGVQAAVVVASDPDAGQSLSYSIISGNTNNAFQINTSTGALTVLNPSALNYEVVTSFALIVKAQDNGQGNLFSQATITVNITNVNENPVISNQTFTIAENSLIWQQVGIVIASDPDAGQTLVYSIISGNTNNAFQINTATGALKVNNAAALNYEVNPSFALTVKVQDNGQGNLFSQAIVTVNLTDVNENPQITDQTFSLDEFSANGTVVGTIIAYDPDNGQSLTYTLLSGNIDNAFLLNPQTGILTVGNWEALNYDTNPIFYLAVQVTDDGTVNLSDQAVVMVNLYELLFAKEQMQGNARIILSPNPAMNYVDLHVENLFDESRVSILNLSGVEVWDKKSNAENGILDQRIELSGLSKGVYILKVTNGSHALMEKFIKL